MAEETEDRSNNQNQSKRSDLPETKPSNTLEGPAGGGGEPAADERRNKTESAKPSVLEGLDSDAAAGADSEKQASAQEAKGEDRGARMNAAKAFYRAMYAGEDVVPDDFGMGAAREPRGEGARSCGNCNNMQQQMSEMEARSNEVENLYKRMAADFDNFRKRTEREREELLGLGVQRAVETLLPAVDDLDRAQGSFTPESDAGNILESLKLVYNRFAKCLEQMGVKPMEVVGQPFDPKYHEPVQQVETNEQPEGAVVHDLRRGYVMRDKVIRPSLVNVAVNTGGKPEHKEKAPPAAEAASTEGTTKETGHARKDIASATAELPALDTLTSAGELTVGTHGHGGEHEEGEAEKDQAAFGTTRPKADAPEHHKASGKHKATKHAHKSEETGDEKKSAENSAELAEITAATDRQGSDE